MTAVCKNSKCYYYDRGFCSKNVVAIDENGMCDEIWYRGQLRRPLDRQPRVKVNIVEGNIKSNGREEIRADIGQSGTDQQQTSGFDERERSESGPAGTESNDAGEDDSESA